MSLNKELIGKAFDGEQKEVVINLAEDLASQFDKKIEKDTEAAVERELRRKGIDREVMGLSDQEIALVQLKRAVAKTHQVWRQNGRVDGVAGKVTYEALANKDAERKAEWLKNGKMIDGVFSTDQPLIIPRVINEVIRESVEPTMVLTPLFERVSVVDAGTTVTFPAVGSTMIAADIPEGGEYPEASVEFAGEVTAKLGKSGIAVKLTDEMIRYSMFDIMGLHLREAAKGLIRHKEQKVANQIFQNGTDFFDNSVAGSHTTGRGANGAGNDTITLDDILLMYADMSNDGFIPDTLIVHPFAWFGMAREPVMRALFMAGFGGGQYYQTYEGSIASAEAWKVNTLNNTSTFSDPSQLQTTYTTPGILPTPLRMIVTPFQNVDTAAYTSTITMCTASELGLILEDEPMSTEEFDDPARDIRKVKIRERYALALKNGGNAIRHAKNVNWYNKGYALDDLLTWQAGSGDLPSLSTGNINIL